MISASTKRSHEWVSGVVGSGSVEQSHRQSSMSPVAASPAAPPSPSSSNVSVRKKMVCVLSSVLYLLIKKLSFFLQLLIMVLFCFCRKVMEGVEVCRNRDRLNRQRNRHLRIRKSLKLR